MHLKVVDTREDILMVEKLAKEVWEQHYTPIIGEEQVAYMLKKFQSANTMTEQLHAGYLYYIINFKNEPVGYLSILPKENELFLSKIYVLQHFQGKGLGKFMLNFVFEMAVELKKDKVALTVNKYNDNAIRAYEKMGFINVDAVVTNIGSGYVMDDFIMEKSV
ncbi:GNAT family N-acetyltransferase [Urechidicola vernalis]|uniref:GNAT family N-acetyltransferase n=1 Tax=Urechidicola vernalis TaxID=3075600 RepID=A0ABU2Y6G6_9FLAO|nr:GNAT family N-acetyltransferase [Urechidicola sp. P050]MDT0553790.1 GNAT family N-acetyltransferase [Urechidicola sp. P050]